MTDLTESQRKKIEAQRRPGDPESGQPNPVRADTFYDELASERPVRASTGALVLSAILPGSGHFLVAAPIRGTLLLLAWGVLLGTTFLGRAKLIAIGKTGSLDLYIATVVLVLGLIAVWAYAFFDLKTGRAQSTSAQGDSQWRIAMRHFRKSKVALAGLFIIILLYLVALLAPLLAPYDPIAQENVVQTSFLKPSHLHWLGTDRFGRDILSRLLYGSRISLAIGFVATAISVTLGTLLGAVAGYFGGKVDSLIMRFTDLVLAFPRLILLILIVALFSPSISVMIIVLGLTQWPNTTRIVRGDVLSLREREFIQAARALGLGRARIILRHLIPNVLAPVIVTATLGIGNTIVLEAGLSFLGLGVQSPTPSWGNMVADGKDVLISAWWSATFPGLIIVLTVLAFNLVGDGLRDALDPEAAHMIRNLLEVTDLRTYFRTDAGEARAVDGVSFRIAEGEVLGIVGESGSGKSVTSLSLMRLVPQPPGQILPGSGIKLRGEDLVTASEQRMQEIRGNDIAMIFQEPMTSLNPVFTVGEQIAESIRLHRKMKRKEARNGAIEMLRLVGIPNPDERVDHYPHQLSGGQRQRVMIAMALSCEPALLIADEPTTALDVTIQAQILELLAELRERLGMAIVLITHDLGVVAEVCDRVAVMYAGEIVEEGSVEQIFSHPRHPYTEGLMRAIPRLGEKSKRLAVIPGSVPSATAWPVGCRFHTRCPYGWDLCVKKHPELFETHLESRVAQRISGRVSRTDHPNVGHRSRCWLEQHPERRAAVLETRDPFATGVAPAEIYHEHAAASGESTPDEPESESGRES